MDEQPNDDEDSDIMNHLNYRKLEMIYNDYLLLGGKEGLDLGTFVKVMLQHLPDTGNKILLVRNLIELFSQIDVNNDCKLEWEEFTNHIIELGMVRRDRIFIDAIKNYNLSPIQGGKHDTEIEQMFFLEKLKHLLVMERDAKRFKVYNARNGKWLMNVPARQTGNGGSVIAADYIHHGNIKLVATTSNNNSINFWDSNTYVFNTRLNTSEIQLTSKSKIFKQLLKFNSKMVW